MSNLNKSSLGFIGFFKGVETFKAVKFRYRPIR